MERRRYELESVEPLHVLHVVAVGPEGVRNVVRAGAHASTKAVAGVDVLSGHDVGTAAQVADDVIEPRVVNVIAERGAVDRAFGRRRQCPGTAPPERITGGEENYRR